MATQSIANLRHILYGSLQRATLNRYAEIFRYVDLTGLTMTESGTMAQLNTVLAITDNIYRDRFCSFCVAQNVSMFGNAKLLDAPCLGGHGSHWFFENKQSSASRDDRHLNRLLLENTPQPNVDMSGVLYLEAILPAKSQDASGGGLIFVDGIDTYPYHEDLVKRLQGAMIELGFGSFCQAPWDSEIHQYYMTKLGSQALVFSQKYALSKRALLIRLFRECRRINMPCPLGKTERVVVDLGPDRSGCKREFPDPMATIDMGRRLQDLNG